ncbi:Glucan endo-1,3-beta-glucosidase-like protein [Cladobotryum mycophilum]|uniref:Glucan endo-1,3-beta-glucosidase-like protein n=1 Tax=Cladobotryum mycophilum TaxID=491253 RepID=A0ABR0SJY9_9HYPO
MRWSSLLSGALFTGYALAIPFNLKFGRAANQEFSIAHPGGIGDIILTKDNTLNGTGHSTGTEIVKSKFTAAAKPLPFAFVNNFSGGQIYAYIQGIDQSGRVAFVKGDGSYLYPSSGGSEIPIPIDPSIGIPITGRGGTFQMTLPAALKSGRIYFSEGRLTFFVVSTPAGDGIVQPSVANLNDPNAGLNWGFVEFTYTNEGNIFANISYVDFVGMILSMSLKVSDGSGTQLTRGLASNAVSQLCNGLAQQAGNDGRPWNKMCVSANGKVLRVMSPNTYNVVDTDGFKGYWDNYVNQVWSKYTGAPLTINTQTPEAPNTQCRVVNNNLTCSGDNRSYPRPTAGDIWGCNSGPFTVLDSDNASHRATVPRLCAAFVRSTLLLPNGNVQPGPAASDYYKANPTNHYSRIVHSLELDGVGYAFPYDDVNPNGNTDSSGSLHSGAPSLLTVYVGGSG